MIDGDGILSVRKRRRCDIWDLRVVHDRSRSVLLCL